jgi:hypothetical protein
VGLGLGLLSMSPHFNRVFLLWNVWVGLLFVLGMFIICWIFLFLDGSGVFVMIDVSVMFFMGHVFLFFCCFV